VSSFHRLICMSLFLSSSTFRILDFRPAINNILPRTFTAHFLPGLFNPLSDSGSFEVPLLCQLHPYRPPPLLYTSTYFSFISSIAHPFLIPILSLFTTLTVFCPFTTHFTFYQCLYLLSPSFSCFPTLLTPFPIPFNA